jgi:hypothetical protein
VRRRFGSWARPIAGLVTLTLALAVAAPVAAAEASAPVAQPQTTLAASAKATVAALPIPASVQTQAAPVAQTTSTTGSKSFFKTGAGRLALVLMAAGTGFMVYSAFTDNDPVKSQFR